MNKNYDQAVSNADQPPMVPLPAETLFNKPLSEEDRALLQLQWNTFCKIKQAVVLENPIQRRREEGRIELPQGTLLHGTRYDLEKLKKIKNLGIVSGELVGIAEENETYYCADFFRVPLDMSVAQYLEWCCEVKTIGTLKFRKGEFNFIPTPGESPHQIAFIIDAGDPRLQPLIKNDAYAPDSHERMKSIVGSLPREFDPTASRTTSAILAGLPSNFICGIIVSDTIPAEEVARIKQVMGEKTLIYKTTGEII